MIDHHFASVLAHALENEMPQTAAIALAWLETGDAAQVLALLPKPMRGEVLTRYCLTSNEPDMSVMVRDRLIGPSGLSAFNYQAGFRKAVKVMQDLDSLTRHEILVEARQADEIAGERLGALLEDFDSMIPLLHGEELVRLVERADIDDLSLALRASTGSILSRFYAALPDSKAKKIHQDLDHPEKVEMKEILEARERIGELAASILAEDPA